MGRLMTSKDRHCLSRKSDIAKETLPLCFRILRRRDDTGLRRWALNVITSIFVVEDAEGNLAYNRESDVVTERGRDRNREKEGLMMGQGSQQTESHPPGLEGHLLHQSRLDSNANFFQKCPHRHPLEIMFSQLSGDRLVKVTHELAILRRNHQSSRRRLHITTEKPSVLGVREASPKEGESTESHGAQRAERRAPKKRWQIRGQPWPLRTVSRGGTRWGWVINQVTGGSGWRGCGSSVEASFGSSSNEIK